MNPQSYLQSYGWTPGTALGLASSHDPSTTAPRLTKPILTSRKSDNHGIGKKAPNLDHSDLWWEKAFDSSLKSLDVSKDTSGVDKQNEPVDMMNVFSEFGGGRGKRSELYRYFVSGGLLEGTIKIDRVVGMATVTDRGIENGKSKKRKREEEMVLVEEETKEERKKRKSEEKVAKKERKRIRLERRRAKDERRRLRELRHAAKKQKHLRKEKTKHRKSNGVLSTELAIVHTVESDSGVELSRDITPIPNSVLQVPTAKIKEQKMKKRKEDATLPALTKQVVSSSDQPEHRKKKKRKDTI